MGPPLYALAGGHSGLCSACDARKEVDQPVHQLLAPHRHHPLVPRQADLPERSHLRVGDESPMVERLRPGQTVDGKKGRHPYLYDAAPESAEGTGLCLGQKDPGEALIVEQELDECLDPGVHRSAGLSRLERIGVLRRDGNGVVDHGSAQLVDRPETLVEVPLCQTRGCGDGTDAEVGRPLCPDDLKGCFDQLATPGLPALRGADAAEGPGDWWIHGS